MCFKDSLVGIMKEKIKSFATIFLSLTGILILICYAVGYRFFVVETGSMGKKYPVGSMVIVKNTAPEKPLLPARSGSAAEQRESGL